MKVGILAGGRGSRISEETEVKPKPMVRIGRHPIIWHIMMHYAHYGFRDFMIALGYRGNVITDYFRDYRPAANNLPAHSRGHETDWTVDLVETGKDTLTGGRIKQFAPLVGNETFMLTWGDGVANVDLERLLAFHRSHGKLATMTIVRPPARYGRIELDDKSNQILSFSEKPQIAEGWINGAFFVLEPGIFDYLQGEDTMWEHEPLEQLATDGQLMAYKHIAFWQCMDTLREKHILESHWETGTAPWKTWADVDVPEIIKTIITPE